MFVILTSKPGQFRTEPVEGIRAVEAYDYLFGGTAKARFVIATLESETKIRVIDEVEPPVLNLVPSKFLPHYESLEAARQELEHLTSFGSVRATLRPVPVPAAA
ncbi:ferredoxin [Roseicella frigidaeris]|uniref:Ferredoxin n=1 Tax=Roseicella frigidaeris TaxID=2230885 RepID=A0A327M6B0_9PROT|nr:ferredoxin [Roseicella frigidaeris]RAI58037.1 ferredoxin [Roseicella frigidaeris]